jgi:hypothetical protein
MKILVGEHDRCRQDRVTTLFSVDKMIVHPAYRHTDFYADIMLLRLSMKITFNRFVRPICLPQQGKTPFYSIHDLINKSKHLFFTIVGSNFENNWAIVSGWGTENSTGTLQCSLMQTTIPVISQQECKLKSKYPPNALHATLLCAGEIGKGGKDSCQVSDLNNMNISHLFYE